MKRAFTLIELLIVVAIIAILAAIAVPNFLEAQVRAKISRSKNDMRTVATALEAYMVDYNKYPFDGYDVVAGAGTNCVFEGTTYYMWYLQKFLTTPVAFLPNVDKFEDVFRPKSATASYASGYRYCNIDSTWGLAYVGMQSGKTSSTTTNYLNSTTVEWGAWRMTSAGPDRTYGPSGWEGPGSKVSPYPYPSGSMTMPYDSTNGTVSDGDIIRTASKPAYPQ